MTKPRAWARLHPQLRRNLIAGGITTAKEAAAAPDSRLLAIEGIGKGRLAQIREVVNGIPRPPSKAPEPKRIVPAHGGGELLVGGKPGNRGGGRPPEHIRRMARELGYSALELLVRRMDGAMHEIPPRAELEKLEKKALVAMLEEIGSYSKLELNDIRQIFDTTAKYGVGTRNVLVGDDDDGPVRHGIVILPPRDDE